MNWITRIFVSAFARRLAYVLVAALLLWCGVGKAQDMSQCYSGNVEGAYCIDRAAAYAGASARFEYYKNKNAPNAIRCPGLVSGPQMTGGRQWMRISVDGKFTPSGVCAYMGYRRWPAEIECANGGTWDETTATCLERCGDDSFTPVNNGYTQDGIPGGTLECSGNGACERIYVYEGDGNYVSAETGQRCNSPQQCPTGYYKHELYNLCYPEEPQECPEGEAGVEGVCRKKDPCPEGKIEDENGLCKPKGDECPAGQVKGPDGSCVDDECPVGQVRGEDGTCKKDADGDGEPDEGENSFSGGDDCQTPPQCSGDPILCGQAKMQWRIDCNTRHNTNVTGGGCDSPPRCSGETCDAVQTMTMIQTWRTACAAESFASLAEGKGGGGIAIGGAGGAGGPEHGYGNEEQIDPTGGINPGDAKVYDGAVIDGSALNFAGFGGGGAVTLCEGTSGGSAALAQMFATKVCAPSPQYTNFISVLRAIIISMAATTAILILAGWKGA